MLTDSRPLTYTEVASLARATQLDAFAVRLGGPLLVGQTEYQEDDGWSFNTDSNICAIGGLQEGREFILHQDDSFLVIKKSQAGLAFARTILVGRAQSNDVRVAHTSISKLHARIQIGDDGALTLADAESQNGTLLNGRRIEPNQAEPIEHGDWLKFGDCSYQMVGIEQLYETLRRNR